MRVTLAGVALLKLLGTSPQVTAPSAAAISYAPSLQPCPHGISLVREVGHDAHQQKLSSGEAQYVSARQSHVLPQAWAEYLTNVQLATHTALPSYVNEILLGRYGREALPTLGIASSGGGHRAAIFGAGVINTLDGRNRTAAHAGTGGLLQSATYLAGLSGGAWLISSLAQAEFLTIPELVFGATSAPAQEGSDGFGGWLTDIDLLQPSANANATAAFVGDLLEDIALKWAKGFPVTVNDVWGRTLARHFVNGTTTTNFFDERVAHGAGITLSGVAHRSSFAAHAQPFPILIANSLASRTTGNEVFEPGNVVPLNNPIYEFNIFETGSWDPILAAFTPTRYVGSPSRTVCATGFDQISCIEGLSSNLFNQFNNSEAALAASPVGPIVSALQQALPQTGIRLDTAAVPNPFFGVLSKTFVDSDQKILNLVDGGENGEVTPFQPLLVKARGVDTIIAIDASADTPENWANGSSLVATQNRVALFPSTYSFPPVPPSATSFVAHNLTRRPTFFGCNSPPSSDDPLVIYLANGGPPLGESPLTNTSTFQTQYPRELVEAMLDQVFDVATQGIPSRSSALHQHDGWADERGKDEKDALWPACLACAVVDRSRRTLGVRRTGVCETCLERYCWS